MSLYDLYPPMPTELEPYRGMPVVGVPRHLLPKLRGQPCIEVPSCVPVVLVGKIRPSTKRCAVLDLITDCVRYVRMSDLALALEEELPTFLSGESLYLIQHLDEFVDMPDDERCAEEALGWRLHRIPQENWRYLLTMEHKFFDLDRRQIVRCVGYSGGDCIVEGLHAGEQWWVAAHRLVVLSEWGTLE